MSSREMLRNIGNEGTASNPTDGVMMGFVCGLNHGKMGWVIHVGLVMKMQRQMGAKRTVLCMEKRLCNVNGIQHWRNSSTREAEQSVFFVKKEKQYDEMNCSDLIRSTLVGESFPRLHC